QLLEAFELLDGGLGRSLLLTGELQPLQGVGDGLDLLVAEAEEPSPGARRRHARDRRAPRRIDLADRRAVALCFRLGRAGEVIRATQLGAAEAGHQPASAATASVAITAAASSRYALAPGDAAAYWRIDWPSMGHSAKRMLASTRTAKTCSP